MTKALFENKKEIAHAHHKGNSIDPKRAHSTESRFGASWPLKYYKEIPGQVRFGLFSIRKEPGGEGIPTPAFFDLMFGKEGALMERRIGPVDGGSDFHAPFSCFCPRSFRP